MIRIERATSNSIETVTITITKLFEAKELYYLKEYSIKDLKVNLVDLEKGQIILSATTISTKGD